MTYTRYAIYYTPPPGPLATFGAAWLGWDPVAGVEVAHPDLDGLPRPVAEMTATPRKYGLHGTIKPPFRLAEGHTEDGLRSALAQFAARTPATGVPRLTVAAMGGFVAMVPEGDSGGLTDLAGKTVEAFDEFRSPPGDAELARRRAAGLSERQEALLQRWGYPYVMDQFRFHLTLSGRLEGEDARRLVDRLTPEIAPHLSAPFPIDALTLLGEAPDGRFRELHRYTLAG